MEIKFVIFSSFHSILVCERMRGRVCLCVCVKDRSNMSITSTNHNKVTPGVSWSVTCAARGVIWSVQELSDLDDGHERVQGCWVMSPAGNASHLLWTVPWGIRSCHRIFMSSRWWLQYKMKHIYIYSGYRERGSRKRTKEMKRMRQDLKVIPDMFLYLVRLIYITLKAWGITFEYTLAVLKYDDIKFLLSLSLSRENKHNDLLLTCLK